MSIVEDPIQDTSGSCNNANCKFGAAMDGFQDNDNANNFQDSNEHELPLNDEDDFDDMENEGLGLVMDVRSTTFRNLNEMIPRGYGDLTDLTKKEEEIVTNERSNLDVTGSSSPSHDPLEEMKIRNQEKWAQLGYDPKAGRGNMKMSITLSNFKPSAIIQQGNGKSTINSHLDSKTNDINKNLPSNQSQQSSLASLPENNENTNNSYSTQVLQSYSMCLNPNKHVQRVNSSNDPSVFIGAQSISDEHDHVQNLSSSGDEPIAAANLNTAALLASFQPLEKDLQSPDHSDELNNFNHMQNNASSNEEDTEQENYSSGYAENSVSDPQTTASNSEHEEENKIEENNNYRENNASDEKMVVPQTPKSPNSSFTSGESKSSSKDSTKNDQSLKSSKTKKSKAQSQYGYECSAYNDPSFDYEAASKDVPPELLKIVKYPKTGIVFRAICGQSMSQYPKGVAQYVIADLRTILEKCISKNMVTESIYLSSIIDSIKTEIGTNLVNKKAKFNEERFIDAEESLTKKQQYWANQKAILNSEKEVKLQEIELRYQDELENLEMLWNSEKKRAQFNKPSAQLIILRQSVQVNLAAKRFQEAAQLASKAEKLDRSETELAAQRMRQAYSSAAERLKQKFEQEREIIFQSFEAKRCSLAAQEEADLRPIENRIQKYNNNQQQQQIQSDQADCVSTIDNSSCLPTSATATRRSISVVSKTAGNYGPIIKKPLIKAPKMPSQANAKLKLPLLKPNT